MTASRDEGARARTVQALGLVARRGDAAARERLLSTLADPGARVRRAAISSLANLAPVLDEVRAAVLARWDANDVTPDERRTLAEALGKLGGAGAVTRLRALDPGDDAELARRRDRGLLVAERGAQRGSESEIRIDVAPPMPLAVVLHCKAGLSGLLVDELRALLIEAQGNRDDEAHIALDTPWSTLFQSRLWVSAGIRVPRPQSASDSDAVVRSIVDGLTARARASAARRVDARARSAGGSRCPRASNAPSCGESRATSPPRRPSSSTIRPRRPGTSGSPMPPRWS